MSLFSPPTATLPPYISCHRPPYSTSDQKKLVCTLLVCPFFSCHSDQDSDPRPQRRDLDGDLC
uniref:Uncharacterized protein n=1 Tax=Arundo donax TaxID=35708 RepID=A0A0A8Z4Z2_ARUDO